MIESVMTICVMVNPRCCVVVLLLGFIYAITSVRANPGPTMASAVPGRIRRKSVAFVEFAVAESRDVLLLVTAVRSRLPITTDYAD